MERTILRDLKFFCWNLKNTEQCCKKFWYSNN